MPDAVMLPDVRRLGGCCWVGLGAGGILVEVSCEFSEINLTRRSRSVESWKYTSLTTFASRWMEMGGRDCGLVLANSINASMACCHCWKYTCSSINANRFCTSAHKTLSMLLSFVSELLDLVSPSVGIRRFIFNTVSVLLNTVWTVRLFMVMASKWGRMRIAWWGWFHSYSWIIRLLFFQVMLIIRPCPSCSELHVSRW